MEKRTHCTTYQQTSDFACFRLILAVFAGSAHVCFVGKNNVTFILILVQKSGCGTNNYSHTVPNILRNRTRTVSSEETVGEFNNAPTATTTSLLRIDVTIEQQLRNTGNSCCPLNVHYQRDFYSVWRYYTTPSVSIDIEPCKKLSLLL